MAKADGLYTAQEGAFMTRLTMSSFRTKVSRLGIKGQRRGIGTGLYLKSTRPATVERSLVTTALVSNLSLEIKSLKCFSQTTMSQ